MGLFLQQSMMTNSNSAQAIHSAPQPRAVQSRELMKLRYPFAFSSAGGGTANHGSFHVAPMGQGTRKKIKFEFGCTKCLTGRFKSPDHA